MTQILPSQTENTEAHESFIEITEAYESLSNV